MNNNPSSLDELFQKAREQAPEASFEETSARFLKSIAPANPGGKRTDRITKLLSANKGLLFLGLTLLIAATFFLQPNPSKPEEQQATPEITATEISPTFPETETETQTKSEANIPESPPGQLEEKSTIPIKKQPEKNIPSAPPTTPPKDNQPSELPQKEQITNDQLSTVALTPEKTSSDLTLAPTPASVPEPAPKSTFTPPEQSVQPVLFTVTEKSEPGDLSRISRLAKEAGIEYNYIRATKKGSIREFKAKMVIKGTEIQSFIYVSVAVGGTFAVSFGWYADENGKAIKLTDDLTIEEAKSKHRLFKKDRRK